MEYALDADIGARVKFLNEFLGSIIYISTNLI